MYQPTFDDKAYAQGRADCSNNSYFPDRCPEHVTAYKLGWYDQSEWKGEASLRWSETYGGYGEPMPTAEEEREEAYERWLDGERWLASQPPYDPETGHERDPFMAYVLAVGEEAQRESDAAWIAGAPERKRIATLNQKFWRDSIPF